MENVHVRRPGDVLTASVPAKRAQLKRGPNRSWDPSTIATMVIRTGGASAARFDPLAHLR